VFVLAPIVGSLFFSLTNMRAVHRTWDFIGLENWIRMFEDLRFMNSLQVTVTFAFSYSVIVNICALALAFFLQIPKGKTATTMIRSMLFLPTVLTPVVMGFVWRYIFLMALPDIIISLGLQPIEFLGAENALGATIFITSWLGMGTALIIYTASLNNISSDIYEAAILDGASRWKYFIKIAFPLITPGITINVVLCIINGFRQFDQILAMTRGGPGYITEAVTLLIYHNAFNKGHYGYATTQGFFLFIIVITVSTIIIRVMRKREVSA